MAAPLPVGGPAGSPTRVFRNRNFRLLWIGAVTSSCGSSIGGVVITWVVYSSTHSPLAIALLGVVGFIPSVAFGLLAGAMVDRLDRRRLMIACDLGRVAVIGTMALYIFLFGANLVVILAVALIVATFSTIFRPAGNAILPSLLNAREVTDGNGLLGSGTTIAGFLGSPVGGVLLVSLGTVVGLAINSLTYAVSAAMLVLLVAPVAKRKARAPGETPSTILHEIREGLRFLASQRALLFLTLSAFVANFFLSMFNNFALTDPDARSMATSGRGSGVVGYNVQVAVETEHHLIITHEVTNVGTDRSQLSHVAKEAKATLEVDNLDAVADRGYFSSKEILACEEAGITVTLPKPMTSHSKAEGRFGKQDFRYVAEEDVYICPAGGRLAYSFTTQENGLVLRRYLTNACQRCAIKQSCTTGKERRISRWEHEDVLEAVQRRLDEHPEKMRQRRETVEHPFGTIKARMGATHFLMKTLPRVASEMALHVLAYNLTRVMNIMGIQPLMAAIRA